MIVSKKEWEALKQRTADLESQVQNQQNMLEIVFEFCRSVANKNKTSILSYQQLYSPSPDRNKKIRMLFEQMREF